MHARPIDSRRSRNARPAQFILLAAAFATRLLSTSAEAALPVFYGPSESGDPNGLSQPVSGTTGYSVNNAGVAIGSAYKLLNNSISSQFGYRWRAVPNDVPLQLAGLATGVLSSANAINDAGVIVGDSQLIGTGGSRIQRGVLYANPASVTGVELKSQNNTAFEFSTTFAVNRSGIVIGAANQQPSATPFAKGGMVKYAPGSTTPTLMNQLSYNRVNNANSYDSAPAGINDRGDIIGRFTRFSAGGANLGPRAGRWGTQGAGAELQPINSQPDGYSETAAVAINASGVVVGSSAHFAGFSSLGARAVRWNTGTTAPVELQHLGNTDLNGLSIDIASDNNDANVAVGIFTRYTPDGSTFAVRPVRWDANNIATELGDIGGTSPTRGAYAQLINNVGGVAGIGSQTILFGGDDRAVVWAPNSTAAIDLATLVQNAPGTSFVPNSISSLSDTGFVTGVGTFTNASGTKLQRLYTMMVPQVGTYGRGDATFDTIVNFDDLVVVAQNYNKNNPSAAVTVGDFNLDGIVNFDDLVPLAQNYNKTVGTGLILGDRAFSADWALAQSLVPEPTTLALIAIASILCGRQRTL